MEQTNRKTEKTNGTILENSARLREILSILNRHDILKGMNPVKLRLITEELGPTFVKIGQILSMRLDMLPPEYCEELSKLRATVTPLPFCDVKKVVEDEYHKPLGDVFESFEEEPLGSASIAQVHGATLSDGTAVVVKVQRPGIYGVMERDILLLRRAIGLLKVSKLTGSVIDFDMVLAEMWAAAQQEMDFLCEAANGREFFDNCKDIAYITCPKIIDELTTKRVLVMERIDGIQIDNTGALKKEGYDLEEIGLKLAENYIKQIVDDGFFQADPHPGNLRIREGQIVFLDLGMMGRLTARDQELLKNAIRAMAEGDIGELKNALLAIGVHRGPVDHARLYADLDDMIGRYAGMEMARMDLGSMFQEVLGLAGRNGISMPKGVTMLSRGVMTIQGVLAKLAPDLNLVTLLTQRMSGRFFTDFDVKKEGLNSARALYHSAKKAMDIPAQISDLLKMSIKGQTKLNFELSGAKDTMKALEKMVNRLIVCIITAATLIGSSLICTTNMQPQLLGIPVLGILGFFTSFALGILLLISVWRRKK